MFGSILSGKPPFLTFYFRRRREAYTVATVVFSHRLSRKDHVRALRYGSTKRVASSRGEASIGIEVVRQQLNRL
jgi:hypothetical protein